MRSAARTLATALGLAIAASTCLPAQAELVVRRTDKRLQNAPSRFAVAPDAPRSIFQLQASGAEAATGARASTFGRAAGPAIVIRSAEVPAERMALTRDLLSSLKARQTASKVIVVELPADVLFDFDKASLRPDARERLAKAAELLRSYPNAPVSVEGHTDSKGESAYNDDLARRRAQAVADDLRTRVGRAMGVRGFGETRPVVPNARRDGSDDPAGRQRNRRVEIHILPVPPAK